jgi:hypothetical protein
MILSLEEFIVWGREGVGRYSCAHSSPQYQVEMSGQLHVPVALLPITSAMQPLWTLRRTEKYLGYVGNRTVILRVLSPQGG